MADSPDVEIHHRHLLSKVGKITVKIRCNSPNDDTQMPEQYPPARSKLSKAEPHKLMRRAAETCSIRESGLT